VFETHPGVTTDPKFKQSNRAFEEAENSRYMLTQRSISDFKTTFVGSARRLGGTWQQSISSQPCALLHDPKSDAQSLLLREWVHVKTGLIVLSVHLRSRCKVDVHSVAAHSRLLGNCALEMSGVHEPDVTNALARKSE
jgi:hypothetical protein